MRIKRLLKTSIALLMLAVVFSMSRTAFASEIQTTAFVESRPVAGDIGTWVIGGVTVEADAETTFDGAEAELQVDYCVELKYVEGDGGNSANQIKAKSRSYCEAVLTERGLVNSFPVGLEGAWTIAGESYSADVNTDFDGDFAEGVCVEVKSGETTSIATEIKERSDSDCQVTHRGLVEDRPVGDVGVWTIGGIVVTADAETDIDGDAADMAINYCVEATYLNDGADNPAVELKSRSRSDCEAVVTTRGVIRTVPVDNLGTWDISGDLYTSDANTELKQDKGDFAAGVCADVTHGAETSVATKIETRDSADCNATIVGLVGLRPPVDVIGTWTVAGVSMAVDGTTVFDGDDDDFATGYCVEATYFADELTNPAVKLKSKSRSDCEDTLTARERVDSFPAGLEGTWIIGGESYIADANTEFKQDKGDFAVDVCVEVRYGATSTIAVKIETRETTDCVGPEQKIVDLIVSRPVGIPGVWTVGDVTATATTDTQVDGAESKLAVGYCVEMKYADDGGSDVVTSIKAKDRKDCEAVVTTRGRIDALPAGLLGEWGIGGMSYLVDENTEQKTDKGAFELGVCVEVTYGADTTIATKVESRVSTDCMGPEVKIVDFIEDRPDGTLLGTWLIGGISAEVDANTDVAADDADLTVGTCVELKYRADGSVNLATRLEDKNRSDCEEFEETRGLIDSFPAELIGTWVVAGVSYETDADTEFKQDKGDFADDVCVQVRYGLDSMIAVKIESREADDCLGSEMKETGLIALRPTDMVTGTWTIGAVTVEADADTLVDGEDSQLQAGYCAEVKYVDDDGTDRALSIKAKDRSYCEEIDSADGIIDSLPTEITGNWVISGTTYIVDDNTALKEKNGPFAVGACVRVDYGATTGIAVKLETRKGCGIVAPEPEMYERVYGTIESFPATLEGNWVINGDTYVADAETELKSKKGPLAIGACAKVDYLPSSGLALKIESADSDHCSDDGEGGHKDKDAKVYGYLDSWPTALSGTWVVDGVSYEAGIGTQFKEDKGLFEVGVCVEVKYLTATNVMLKVETETDYHCGGVSNEDGSYAELVGEIDSLPVDWLGTWVIDGVSYSADDTTDFKEKYSGFEVGACVKIKYQTANSLALKIESKNPYDCQDTTTPPADSSAALTLNATTGGPGSTFIVNGDGFAPDSSAIVNIDGEFGGIAVTDSSGSLTFALATAADGRAAAQNTRSGTTPYVVSVTVGDEVADDLIIQVDATQGIQAVPDNYTGPSLPLGQTPTAARLVSSNATGINAGFVTVLIALILAGMTLFTVFNRRHHAEQNSMSRTGK